VYTLYNVHSKFKYLQEQDNIIKQVAQWCRMLAIGSEVRGLKPGRGNGFLRVIKIRSMLFLEAK
jgi:hypothetical protein